MNRSNVLRKISKSALYGNLGLFIVAGMSKAVLNIRHKYIALSWSELIKKVASEFEIDYNKEIQTHGVSYPQIATELAKIISRKNKIEYDDATRLLKEKIAELTAWYPEVKQQEEYGDILKRIRPSWIITTNYDLILECLLAGSCTSLRPTDQLISQKDIIPIYHLHGVRTIPDSIVISNEDYVSLFRPNEYRQQKLSLSIKESTTVMIGYSLGDLNVQTALDWSNNVYSEQTVKYPHAVIQLVYSEKPKTKPYIDTNNIIVVEFNDLQSLLEEIAIQVDKDHIKFETKKKDTEETVDILDNPTQSEIDNFIDNRSDRQLIINRLASNNDSLISAFLVFFSLVMEETWIRAVPSGAFHAYNENILILLDFLEEIDHADFHPALFEAVAYNFYRVSPYVSDKFGASKAAYKTWNKRKSDIQKDNFKELVSLCKNRRYYKAMELLED